MLQIQSKLELMLMVYQNTVENRGLPNEELQRRAADMKNYFSELQSSIDELPDIDDTLPSKDKLQTLFLEKDRLIDKYNLLKGELDSVSKKLDDQIAKYIQQ